MRITMDDIAKAAKVSRQTVSCALSGSDSRRISAEKRREIREIAESLGFRPNYAALQLKGRRSDTIAIFLPTFFEIKMATVWSLVEAFRQKELKTFVMPIDSEEHFVAQVNDYLARDVLGFISVGLPFRMPGTVKHPFVRLLTDGDEKQPDIDFDRVAGARMVTEHLIAHGRRSFGFLNMGRHPHSLQKIAGIKQACDAAGIAFDAEACHIDVLQRPDACNYLLAKLREHKMDALVCNNDLLAGKAMAFVRQAGFRVPEDIAFFGCAGYTFTEFTDPPLATIVEPYDEIGRLGARMMLDLLTQGRSRVAEPVLLMPKLILSGSCGCPIPKITRIYWEGPMGMLEKNTDFIKPPPEHMLNHDGYLLP